MMIRRSNSLIASSYLNYPATKKIIRILEEDYSIDPDDYSAILKTVDNYLKSVNSSKKMQIKSSAGGSLTKYQKDLISDIAKSELESGSPIVNRDEIYNIIAGDFDDDFAGVTDDAVNYYLELVDCGPACMRNKSNSDDSYLKNYDDIEYALASSKKPVESQAIKQESKLDLDTLNGTVSLIKQNYPCYATSDVKTIAQDFSLSDEEAEYVLSQLKGVPVDSSEDTDSIEEEVQDEIDEAAEEIIDSKKKSKYNGCNVTGRENGMAPQAAPVASSFGLF